jgi:hypothetical protein
MTSKVGQKAAIPNPALTQLNFLIGQWDTTGKHPYLTGVTLHGRVSFEWFENGSFLVMHTEIDNPRVPSGISIFGSDDKAKKYYMLYFDERGVSRKYNVSFSGGKLKWWRNHHEFSQRFVVTASDDALTMVGQGEMKRSDSPWEKDLDLAYTRVTEDWKGLLT